MSKEQQAAKQANQQLIQNQQQEYLAAQQAAKQAQEKAQKESVKLEQAEKERQKKAQEQEVAQKESQAKYEQALSQYSGNQGYQNALNQATKGAAVTSGQAGLAAQQSARQSGMSKAAAAQMGASQSANAYANNIANQQNMATQTGQANLAGQLSNAGLTGQFSSANTQNAQTGVANTQQGIANQMNLASHALARQGTQMSGISAANANEDSRQGRIWNNINNSVDAIGKTLGASGQIASMIAMSDEKTKEKEKVELPDVKKAIENVETRLMAHAIKTIKTPKDAQGVGLRQEDFMPNVLTIVREVKR